MALKGVTVVELAGLVPAPICGMILADFGATVIRVDKVGSNGELDFIRNGKQSIAINLKTKEGVDVLRKLCKTSDVLIEPYRKGVMEKLGVGPAVLLKDNPRLIYARITGYGQDGPFCDKPCHGINCAALTGILSLIGRFGEKPITPLNLLDGAAGGGLTCALGIILALYARTNSNRGQVIDSNMLEGIAYLGNWLYRARNTSFFDKERGKNIADTGAHFYEVYDTKDNKYMAVGAFEPQFYDNLIRVLGLTLDDVPQYGDFENGKKLFASQFKEKTQEEWCRIFDTIDACVTPVLSLDEAPLHPHNLHRKTFIKTNGGFVPRPAPILSETPGESVATKPAPKCGQNTESILLHLGYTADEIKNLIKEGTVQCSIKAKL